MAFWKVDEWPQPARPGRILVIKPVRPTYPVPGLGRGGDHASASQAVSFLGWSVQDSPKMRFPSPALPLLRVPELPGRPWHGYMNVFPAFAGYEEGNLSLSIQFSASRFLDSWATTQRSIEESFTRLRHVAVYQCIFHLFFCGYWYVMTPLRYSSREAALVSFGL